MILKQSHFSAYRYVELTLSNSRTWADIEKAINPVITMLDEGDSGEIQGLIKTAPTHWGAVFFELLFGADAKDHPTIFRTAFHQPPPQVQPNPIRAPLRLRIVSGDPQLLGLPWRLTVWERRLLIDNGWLFLTSQAGDPTTDYVTTAPCEVLIVAPAATNEGAPDPNHITALAEVLKNVWPREGEKPHYLRSVRTVKVLDNALRGQRPHLVYVYGHTMTRGGQPCLLFDSGQGSEPLPLSELAQLFQRDQHPPAVLYLNIHSPADINFAQLFGDIVPLVIGRRLSRWQNDSCALAAHWLGSWLREGKDPVEALHQVCRKNFATSTEANTLVVHSNYRHWRTDTRVEGLRDRLPHLRLDREKQKGMVAKWLGEMAGSNTLRVMTLVPYGEPRNRLDHLREQLCHHMELALADRIKIKPVSLQFPESREALRRDLEYELREQLQADEGEPVKQLLRRHAPRYGGKGRPILWLDWGVFGTGSGQQASLNSSQLGEWLDFTSSFLRQHCPDDIRIVCSLTLTVASDMK